jgi:hypothetical protein
MPIVPALRPSAPIQKFNFFTIHQSEASLGFTTTHRAEFRVIRFCAATAVNGQNRGRAANQRKRALLQKSSPATTVCTGSSRGRVAHDSPFRFPPRRGAGTLPGMRWIALACVFSLGSLGCSKHSDGEREPQKIEAQAAPTPVSDAASRPAAEPLTEAELALIAADPQTLTPEERRARSQALRKQIMQDPDSPRARALLELGRKLQTGEVEPPEFANKDGSKGSGIHFTRPQRAASAPEAKAADDPDASAKPQP